MDTQSNKISQRRSKIQGLPSDVRRAVSYIASGSPLPSRVVRYLGKIKVEEVEDGEKRWMLVDQILRLPQLDNQDFSSWAELVRKVMEILDQGDEGFAQLLGIPVATVRAWKQGVREPSGSGRRLLEVSIQVPEVLLYAIRTPD